MSHRADTSPMVSPGTRHRACHAPQAVRRAWRWFVAGAVLALASAAALAWDAKPMRAAAERLGPAAVEGARALAELIESARPLGEAAQAQAVNQFFNRRILFRDDVQVWGQADYWASPLETLARGQGDCEDYAIAKYFSLTALGVAPARLRLVYVRAVLGAADGPAQAHMVLAYFPTASGEPLILDNLVPDLLPASRRPNLTPVFSFNAEGLWQGSTPAGDPLARLSRWREVLAKAREQGFP
ncbi:MAG: transglutaminase-like cysteine peptidase [Burkholderiales bacterium]